MNLRPYQEEAIINVFHEWESVKNTLIICPTGTGKTVIFSEIIRRLLLKNKKVLVLAHRSELLEQASTKMGYFGIHSELEKAECHADLTTTSVVVASIQSISRDNRLQTYSPNAFDVIIIDEAHHAVSDTYLKVIDYFKTSKLLGVTATPNRADIRNISSIFETVAYQYGIKEAIEDEYLSPIKIRRIPLKIDLSNVNIMAGDYATGELGNALEPYLETIADKLQEVAMNRKTLIFTPTIAIGEEFSSLLNEKGFRSACVSSKNTTDERKDIINRLHTGELNIVTNSMLWTEGFDEPSIDCIINLRATKSEGLFMQIMGRGLRLSPETNKQNLLYLDFLWHTGKNGYDILSPINIFIDNTKLMDANIVLNEGNEEDIFELEEKAEKQMDARLALAEKLKNAKKRYFMGTLVKEVQNSSLTYKYSGNQLDGIIIKNDEAITFYTGKKEYEYIPFQKWELDPITEKQKEFLVRTGFDIKNIPYKGLALRLINNIYAYKELDRCSFKQYRFLTKKKFVNVQKWKKDEASSMMDKIAKNNWRIPFNIRPLTYKPDSMKVRCQTNYT